MLTPRNRTNLLVGDESFESGDGLVCMNSYTVSGGYPLDFTHNGYDYMCILFSDGLYNEFI